MRISGRTIRHIICMALVFVLSAGVSEGARPAKGNRKRTENVRTRSADRVRKDRKATGQRISETAGKLDDTGRQLKKQLNRLTSLTADIEASDGEVKRLRMDVDSLGRRITSAADSISRLETELENLRVIYAKALRRMQPSGGRDEVINFIFSAGSFNEAYNRIRYLRRFSAWREDKVADINATIDSIALRRRRLSGLRHAQDRAYRQAEEARRHLARQQNESKELVISLRKENTRLKAELERQKRQARNLDRELERIIAAEQARIAREEKEKARKAAAAGKKSPSGAQAADTGNKAGQSSSRKAAPAETSTRTAASTKASELTGSFASNKGRLLFPVAGKYKIIRKFGRQPHPVHKHVVVDCSGIDIEVGSGTSARAVYGGTVSFVFRQEGYGNIVMLRHGKYITVYGGLDKVSVRQGETVKAGQSIGRVMPDPEDDGRSILHFEVRDEKRKLNPTAWVR